MPRLKKERKIHFPFIKELVQYGSGYGYTIGDKVIVNGSPALGKGVVCGFTIGAVVAFFPDSTFDGSFGYQTFASGGGYSLRRV